MCNINSVDSDFFKVPNAVSNWTARCNQLMFAHLPAVCQQKLIAVGRAVCPPYLEFSFSMNLSYHSALFQP